MPARRPWSLELRLRRRLLAVFLSVGALTAGMVGIHYGSDVTDLHQRLVLEMAETLADDMAATLDADGLLDPDAARKDWIFDRYPDAYGWELLSSDGRVIAASGFDWDSVEEGAGAGIDEWTLKTVDGIWLAGKEFACGANDCRIVTAVASDPAHRFLQLVLNEMLVHVLLPVVPFAVFSIWAVSGVIRQTLKPLSEIAEQARAVSEFRDIQPLKVENPPDEVVDLVQALNGSLTRLAAAMERERAFILDASHTLRTPLAALKARLQLEGDEPDLGKLRRDIDALIRLSTQLLAHANADRLNVLPDRKTDFSELIVDVVSRMEPLAHAAGVDLGCEGCDAPLLVTADPDGISIALVNLIENAIEHSRAGTAVTVYLHRSPLAIAVEDQGPGVPLEKLPEISKRFTRASQGRGHGAGLGLAIVDQIMRAHGGRLKIANNHGPGLTVTLDLSAA